MTILLDLMRTYFGNEINETTYQGGGRKRGRTQPICEDYTKRGIRMAEKEESGEKRPTTEID